ncbi:hypothetical protein AB0I10_39655, partial [Streptomyces sp. NPDC050636]
MAGRGELIYRIASTSELAWPADTDEDSGWIDAYSDTEFADEDEDEEPEGEILARSLRLSRRGGRLETAIKRLACIGQHRVEKRVIAVDHGGLSHARSLVVTVRETPLNGPTLKHLVALDEAGAVV